MNLKSGMSIVEVSIVLAILVLLAAISLPTFFQNQKKAREAELRLDQRPRPTAPLLLRCLK